MPAEIADSDDESDVRGPMTSAPVSTSVPTATPSHVMENGVNLSPSMINFDQFLSPTQALSQVSKTQQPNSVKGTGSTDEILRRLTTIQPLSGSSSDNTDLFGMPETRGATSTKRRRASFEEGSRNQDDLPGKKKRVKTYGSGIRSTIEDESSPMFEQIAPTTYEPTATENLSVESDELRHSSVQNDQGRMISLLGGSTNSYNRQLSTSMASMGGYQSINLDFRGNSVSDLDANPFGAPTQMSNDARLQDSPDTEKLTKFFRNPEAANDTLTGEGSHLRLDEVQGDIGLLDEVDTSAPLENGETTPSRTKVKPSHRVHTDMAAPPRDVSSPIQGSMRRAISTSVEPQSASENNRSTKKRGRKPKKSKLTSEPVIEDVSIDIPQTRPRGATLDSVSQASQTDDAPGSRKRKAKNKQVEAIMNEAEISPIKNPSSELNLSDEVAIGLPKENYKPRPSRSRSKQIVEETETPTLASKEQSPDPLEETPAQPIPTQTSKKSSKKSKVKRAKTSAAAVLRKSEQMLSDGEEDVIWMEEKPAAVKLELPPEVKTVKKEGATTSVDEGPDNEISDEAKQPAFSIDIRTPVTEAADAADSIKPPPPPPEPKRRGRKPKKRVDTPEVEPLTDLEDEATTKSAEAEIGVEVEVVEARPALADKSANIQTSTSTTNTKPEVPSPSPTKIISIQQTTTIHSPIKPSSANSFSTRYRIGLSKRQNIPSLLRKVDKTKEPPKVVQKKEKEKKKKGDNGSDDDEDAKFRDRDEHGNLIEWEF